MKFRTLLIGPFFGLTWLPLAAWAGEPCGNAWPRALELNTLFRFDAGAPLAAPAGVARDGTLCVGTTEGYVHALGPDGGYRWSYSVRGAVTRRPLFVGQRWYVATGADRIYAFSPDGALSWVFKPPSSVSSELAADASGTLFFIGADRFVYGVSAHGGVTSRTALGPGTLLDGASTGSIFLENQPRSAFRNPICGARSGRSEGLPVPALEALCDPEGHQWRGRSDGVLEFSLASGSTSTSLQLSNSPLLAPVWSEAGRYALLSARSGVVFAVDVIALQPSS